MKQEKIVCSISDRHCDVDFLRKLFFAGMNVVRMNTAHATREGMENIIKNSNVCICIKVTIITTVANIN